MSALTRTPDDLNQPQWLLERNVMAASAGRHKADVIHLQGRSVSRVAGIDSGLTACLSTTDGAELSSLAIRDVSGVHELLYRGNDWRPVEGWPGRAPWLWPVAGRTYSQADTRGEPNIESAFHWACGDRVLPMPHHGFARTKRWRDEATVLDDRGAYTHASYQSNAEDYATYPFGFRLDTFLAVCHSTVTLTMRVTANPDNNQAMPFTIGQHLTLDLASWWGNDWMLGSLSGAGQSGWGINGLMLASEPIALPSRSIPLSDRVLGDLLIPAVPGKVLRMASPDGTRCIDLSFTASSLPSADAALWVTHCDEAGRFFCMEPWIGWPNGINSGRGRIELKPGEVWSMVFQLNIMAAGRETSTDIPVPGEVHINPAVVHSMPLWGYKRASINQRVTEEL